MSVSINNLFNYSRSLPVPFDTMTNKKVKVASMYGAKTESTLCGSVIKAVHAMCRCMNGTGEGAVGQIDTNKSVAEYKSSVGPDAYHLVVFDAASGSALASVYDKNTELIEQYVAHPSQRDGAAIFFALMPFLMSDAEFDETFQEYYDQFIAGYPDMAKATESMAILCDNAYRRIKDDTCPAHINITVDKSGNLMRVSQGQLDSGSFVPTSVTAGEFTIFAKTGAAVIKKAGVVVEHTDFVGKYPLTPGRTLSALELSLIPKLPEWYIIPPEVVDICKHAQKTTGRPMQMRNFLLRGPAGTGKTMGAKAIAAGLGLPYMKYTCSANTEIFDFTGMIFPETDAVSTGSSELDREREILKSMGGISYANVAKLLRLPDLDDMDYDPAGVYQALTGVENLAATVQDCMSVVLEKVTEKVQALSKRAENRQSSGQNYTYVETDFVKALKHGYLVEVQEPSTIIQPGVLVGLNSLLEQEGSITLPTGEIIRRHPDTVVIVTTNVSYEGCRQMNQSVVDRMSLVKDIELPEPEVMVQRAMAVTGCADEYLVSQMVQVVNDMADYCRKNSITDGACGMRSLIDWVISAEISGDPYLSAKYTVISKATADEEDREALITTILDPMFAPKRKRTSA
ncbi:AAA family ATPase [Pseudoflavonifractor phocaeensis]|uniref:AAA family ATPase n=1 Tax=Pseudoflavonifractor phocaeensis TaxID=1870988 RepID=UPI002109079F|nr:AAA family ATPase [Pseudoflavonifractor phocaeensis]MCQ4865356.1 ATP-binding protein [Pseudoflavonifractor phocaeensis]